jgi:hypothetical protein
MAIKKRAVPSKAREEEIEAFGAAAESAVRTPTPTPQPAAAGTSSSTGSQGVAGDKAKVKTLLIRLEIHEHQLLQEAAALEGRSMHNMLKTILIPGLQAVKEAHKK